MARRRGVDQKIQVTKGFVTEFTPVAFPQEAAIDIENCVIDSDGSIRRRPGIDLEQQFKLNSINGGVISVAELETVGLSNHLWEFVSNSGTLNIVVYQVGVTLQFFAQIGAVSANLLGSVDLTPFAVDAAQLQTSQVEVASGLGDLYVVNRFMDPIRVTFDGTTFSIERITIRIRDFEGLDDSLKVDERPAVLKRNHYYNLRNQGWTDVNIKTFGIALQSVDLCNEASAGTIERGGFFGKVFTDPETGLRSGATWPSNSDIMTVGIVTDSGGALTFAPSFIRSDFLGNTPAPKGHFILDAFNQDLDTALGCAGTGSRVFPTRPDAVAFHQGRAFFTSPIVQNRINGVYFSQQLTTKDRVGNCFQEADPTASEINDLIDTDGGFIPMPGIGEIYALREMANGVVAVASNGIWYITGASDGSGITATNIRVQRVSKEGALSASSIVEAEGNIFYMGIDGILTISTGELGDLTVNNITQNVIQTFYININAKSRQGAAAVYIPEQRKIFWAYRDALATTAPTTRSFNKFLVLDFDIGGFYKYTIGVSTQTTFPEIVGLSFVKPLSENTTELPLTQIDGEAIFNNAGDPITGSATQDEGQITQLKCAVLAFSTVDSGFKTSFATFISRSFTDWHNVSTDGTGIAMSSFVEFAEFNMNAVHTKGRPTYIHSYYSRTSKNLEPGGYYELPPLFFVSTGVRISQSVLEVLNRPSSNLRVSQSVLETLYVAPSDLFITQAMVEVVNEMAVAAEAEMTAAFVALNQYESALAFMNSAGIPAIINAVSLPAMLADTGEIYEKIKIAFDAAAAKRTSLGGGGSGSMTDPDARSCG